MKFNHKTGLVIGIVAASTMLIAPAAIAATSPLSVDGNVAAGNVNVTGDNVGTVGFETDFGVPANCSTADIDGYVVRGTNVVNNAKIGAITDLTFGTSTLCTATDLLYPVVIEKSEKAGDPAEWGIFATETPGKSDDEVNIVIRGVVAKLHSTNTVGNWACDLQAEGDVTGVFNQVNQQIRIDVGASFPLDITSFDGTKTNTEGAGITCGGEIYSTDQANMTGTFTLDTPGTSGIHF